ncbi:MAG TPA: alpha-N-acetylglucosaminidase, partial [Desulfuromonadaceae bacterium]|nr:alpha-N-acetylglucosaminidase [Desulfuromonadaceae bacterium]
MLRHSLVISASSLVIFFALFGQSALAAESPVTGAKYLLQRLLSQRAEQFIVETIPADNGQDTFEIESRDGKIVLRGNDGVSVASALNRYLKDYCHADISWNCGDQLALPKHLPVVPQKIHVISPHRYRYAYNFCTHGYTMAWWDWPRWEHEIDFLALNGVNLALVIEGQESVWIQTLKDFGYTDEEVRAWLVMPSHQPWMYMDNMEVYPGKPGPSPRLVARRLGLGQKIVARMRELGIEPVLPGYYGMVPPDFKEKNADAKVHAQGDWGKLKRPDILDPADPLFLKVATAFYAAQTNLFGGANFYAADPFHEGGSTEGIDIPAAGRTIQSAMQAGKKFDGETSSVPGVTWILQSWQANPRQEMIDVLDKDKLLVLDLFCEDRENWRDRGNFNGTPWLWCTIHNFGGNSDMGGRLAWMGEGPVLAMNDPARGRLSGIGALMEGSGANPILWELFLENAWRSEKPDFQKWLDGYAQRRYGAKVPAAEEAWKILADTIYHAPPKAGEYPINSVVCARPSLDPKQRAREWASTQSYYDTTRLVDAWKLLLDAAPKAKSSDGYQFDLCDLSRQVLANLATSYHRQIIDAYKAGDKAALRRLSDKMLGLIRDMDQLVGTRREFLLGTWLSEARSWGGTPAEKDLCERNARELLTVWTDLDNITDYSNRQWNGLLGEFYLHRWQMWLDALNASLARGVPIDESEERQKIRAWELAWTRQNDGNFRAQPQGDVVAISKKLFAKYSADADGTSGKLEAKTVVWKWR